jgi:hypothetical protein
LWTLDPAIRLRYVEGMTRLSVWYVWHLRQKGGIAPETVPEALCTRVNLYRLTDLWDGRGDADNGQNNPRWLPLVEEIAAWIQDAPTDQVSSVEDRTVGLLRPLLEARVPKDVGPPPVRPFACWTYELGWPGLGSRPGLLGRLTNPAHVTAKLRRSLGLQPAPSRDAILHIMNVMAPRSPFDDMSQLAGTLRALIAEVRERHPQVRELWCNTWLNDYPKFRELLPEVWFQNGVVAPPGNFRNWWGQFARRDGDFNEPAAQKFRSSGGIFPFRALQCHAPIGAIDAYLLTHLKS